MAGTKQRWPQSYNTCSYFLLTQLITSCGHHTQLIYTYWASLQTSDGSCDCVSNSMTDASWPSHTHCTRPIVSSLRSPRMIAQLKQPYVLELFKRSVLREIKEKVQLCKIRNKLTNMLSEYKTPQRVNAQGQPPHRAKATPTDSHSPTPYKVIGTIL